MMEAIKERTKGAIDFEVCFDGALCDATETSECITDGRTDIGFTAPVYLTGELPAANICNVPFQTSNGQSVSNSLDRLVAEGNPVIPAEFEALGQELLYFGAASATAQR